MKLVEAGSRWIPERSLLHNLEAAAGDTDERAEVITDGAALHSNLSV